MSDAARPAGLAYAGRLWRALVGNIVLVSVVQLLAITLSVRQLPITPAVALGVLGLALVAGLLAALAGRKRVSAEPAARELARGLSLVPWLGVAAGALFFLALWYVAYLSPDLTCDGNAYHIPPMNHWARRGYVYWIDPGMQLETLMNGYPKGVELLGFIVVRALQNSQLANTLNLLYLPLGMLGLGVLARRLGAPRPLALLAGAAFVLVPVNIFQAQSAYIDTAYASCAIAFLASLALAADGIQGRTPSLWRSALGLGGATGLTLAAKGSAGLLVLAGYLGLAVVAVVTSLGRRATAGATLRRALALLPGAGLLGLAIGGYWYLRNYQLTGTPLYPVGLTLGGREIFPGQTIEVALWAEGNTPAIYQGWPRWRQIAYAWLQGGSSWPETILGVDNRMGGLGFFWLVGGLPAILYAAARALRRDARATLGLPLALIGGVSLLAFLGTPMNWWPRYTVWIYGVGLPAFALAAYHALARLRAGQGPVWRWLARAWVVLSLALLLYEGGLTSYHLLRWTYPGEGLWPYRRLLNPATWVYPESYLYPEATGTLLEEILTSDAAVAVGPLWGVSPSGRLKHNLLGQLALPIGRRHVMAMPERATPPMIRAARAQGVRYVIWDTDIPLPFALRQLLPERYQVAGFWILVVPPEAP